MNLSAVWRVITSAVNAPAIKAEASASAISIQAQVEYIKLVYEIGIFLLILEREDTVPVSDATRRDFGKLLAHATAVVDQYASAYGLNKADASQITDTHFKDLEKVFGGIAPYSFDYFAEDYIYGGTGGEERFSARDLYAYLLSKPLSDAFRAADKAVLQARKVLADGNSVAERIAKEFGKPLTDLAAAADKRVYELGKNLADSASLSDVARRDFGKYFTDQVGVTDDVDGALSIEDDQEVQFFKFTTDLALASDAFAKTVQFDRKFTDSSAAADAKQIEAGKNLADGSGATDGKQLFTGKPLTDGSGASDSVSKNPGKTSVDAASAADAVFKTPGKVLSDSWFVSDVRTASVGKTSADNALFSDVLYKAGTKPLVDAASVFEAIRNGLSKPLPEPYAYEFFAEEYVNDEIVVLRDAILLNPGKGLSDVAGANDLFYRQVNFARSFGDDVGATDDVDGITTNLDDQEVDFFKFTTHRSVATDIFDRTVQFDRKFADGSGASDAKSIETGKNLADGSGATDATSLKPGKVLSDSAVFADALIRAQGKTIADQSRAVDLTTKESGKSLSDAWIVSDLKSLSLGKVSADSTAFADVLHKDGTKRLVDASRAADAISNALDKPLPEPYAYDFFAQEYVNDEIVVLRDAIFLTPRKGLFDITGASDLFYRQVNYVRSLGDGVGATDDVDGLTTNLDDQELEPGKRLSDTSGVADFLARALSRTLAESSFVTDVRVLSPGKASSDAAGATDVKVLTPGKVLAETSRATDAATKFSGKALTDSAGAADQLLRSPGLVKADTTSISDTGSLANQSYCSDGFYFGGDFVGASRTF